MYIPPRHILLDIPYIEQHYNAQFVLETCINSKLDGTGAWVNNPYLIFYTPIAHPQGSNWMAIGYEPSQITRDTKLIIRDGQSVYNADQIKPTLICAYNSETNQYFTSTHRHDHHTLDTNNNYIDGGRDYIRYSIDHNYSLGYITITVENEKPALVFTPY